MSTRISERSRGTHPQTPFGLSFSKPSLLLWRLRKRKGGLRQAQPERWGVAVLILLSACQQEPTAAQTKTEDVVPCATGTADLTRDCTVERVEGADGLTLVLHRPDGGFRRLRVIGDGRGVVAADGAEPASVRIAGTHRIEVALGGERYLLPATIRRH